MEEKVLTCLTCRVAFADLDAGRDHYKSDWHRYNLKRKVAQMDPVTADFFRTQVVMRHDKALQQKESEVGFCKLCNKVFRSQNALESHTRSKKHQQMQAVAEQVGIKKSQMITRSTSTQDEGRSDEDVEDVDSDAESWDDEEDVLGLEECLFCPHISSSLETNLSHMTTSHSFFLPDTEFISDLEGLVVYLGEMISQGHMCLWCNERSKLFRGVRDVQKHMVDKGHCKIKHDESTRHQFADFYDYRSSYPDADQEAGNEETVDPEMLISNGFELVLPSGSSIGHRSLALYYKQNHGRRTQVVKAKNPLNKVLAGYKALGWCGSTGGDIKQRARDIHYLQRMKNRYRINMETQANKMQFHFREQNPK